MVCKQKMGGCGLFMRIFFNLILMGFAVCAKESDKNNVKNIEEKFYSSMDECCATKIHSKKKMSHYNLDELLKHLKDLIEGAIHSDSCVEQAIKFWAQSYGLDLALVKDPFFLKLVDAMMRNARKQKEEPDHNKTIGWFCVNGVVQQEYEETDTDCPPESLVLSLSNLLLWFDEILWLKNFLCSKIRS